MVFSVFLFVLIYMSSGRHGAGPAAPEQPCAGVLWQREDKQERQLFPFRQIHGHRGKL